MRLTICLLGTEILSISTEVEAADGRGDCTTGYVGFAPHGTDLPIREPGTNHG